MTLVNPQPFLMRAQRDGFALGAFNANTLEQLQAIVTAAEQERAPVIIQISHRALEYMGDGNPLLGLRYAAHMGMVAADSVTAPVALHLDHGTEAEVEQAMKLSFTSVMFDGGDLPFEENVRITQAWSARAHAEGVNMEAELGAVPRADGAGASEPGESTDPARAADFVAGTGIDALAIAIGSVHAVRVKSVRLDLARLEAIRARVQVPLVLHGSSGVTDADIAAGIALGLCKVNVATQLNQAFTQAVRQVLAEAPEEVDLRRYLRPARGAVVARVRERIRFFGASGKAE